ncbi:MAG: hypothetical protein M1456_06995 [Actinobacteria bacterium]|nr:hypothetical protein [Actinomycetota bacterium]
MRKGGEFEMRKLLSSFWKSSVGGMVRVVHRRHDQSGQAIILVLGMLLVLSVVPAVIFNQVSQNAPVTIQVENSKAALAAAQSGVAAYMVHLQSNPAYTQYNDQSCNAAPNDPAFFLPSPCPIALGATPTMPQVASPTSWGEAVPGASASLNERFAYTVNVTASGNPELYVVGAAGIGAGNMIQYRVIQVGLTNSALSYTYFDNYNTSSPYVYSNSAAFKDMMSAMNFVLSLAGSSTVSFGGTTINLSTIQSAIKGLLGNSTVAPMSLGSFFCNYHAYDPNPISTELHALGQAEPSLLSGELTKSGLTGFSILGWNVGQEIASAIEGAVNGVVSSVIGNIPLDGPFPLVCNTASSYGELSGTNSGLRYASGSGGDTGGYYGLTTSMTGKIYSNDSLYTCGNPTWTNADLTFGSKSAFNSANINPLDSISGSQYAYIANDLPNVAITWPIINTTTTFLYGCQGTQVKLGKGSTSTLTNKNIPPPTPAFSQMVTEAASGNTNGGGCLYQGPTFIDLEGSKVQVWSPDTPSPSSRCYANGTAFAMPANGVIYVQNYDPASAQSPSNPTATATPWTSSCNTFPGSFVMLNQTEPIQHHDCHWGDALVQGVLGSSSTSPQNLTIAASNDIVITGNVTYACSSDGGASVPATCQQSLGLAPGGDVPISDPYSGTSGTYYPQGNVIINHPVDSNNNNNNNCTPVVSGQVGTAVNGTSETCGGPAKGPEAPPSYSGSCSISDFNGCIYDIAEWLYHIEYAGYYCDEGSLLLNAIGLGSCDPQPGVGTYTINGHQALATSLAANTGTSNPTAAPYVPQPPTRPTCAPNYTVSVSLLSWPPWTVGSCTAQWLDYYASYGVIGVNTLQQLCGDISGLNCSVGFEGSLQQYEATWVHGQVNSFPAVYDPTIDAMILASDSTTKDVSAYGISGSGTLTTLSAIQNGSFTLQNLSGGNQFIQPQNLGSCPGGPLCWQSDNMQHGLGTLTVAGSVIEQYNDGLQSAGLTSSHFQFLKFGTSGLFDCTFACYVPSGFRHVVLSHAANLSIDPPAGVIGNITGDEWSAQDVTELPNRNVVPWS